MVDTDSAIGDVLPGRFHLAQNYPNPFRNRTTIKYCVPFTTRIRLTVCDLEGEEVQRLVDEEKKAGTYEVEFESAARPPVPPMTGWPDGQVENGQLANGVYFYRLEAGLPSNPGLEILQTRAMILQK